MKLLFFSDIHGNLEAMNAFCHAINKKEYDQIIFCGDAVGYGYHGNEVCALLQSMNVAFVRGNHDQMLLDIIDGKIDERDVIEKYGASYQDTVNSISKEALLFLRTSVDMIDTFADGLHIAIVHGSVDNHRNGRVYPDTPIKNMSMYENYDYVIGGHTHYRMYRTIGNSTIVNPGSAGQPRDGNLPSYAVLDTSNKNIGFQDISYPLDAIIREIHEKETDGMAERMVEIWERGKR